MRWTLEDMKTYEGAKEYIDTALIPVYLLAPDALGVAKVKEQRWLEEICVYAERQLTGRIVLFPTLYLVNEQTRIPIFESEQFQNIQWITTQSELHESLTASNYSSYLLERNENEDDLSIMVKEGKRLTQQIMNQWKK
ncbi:DUF2487 family protein [Ammoniphilus sp. CFH 90114]|uniref:DUF2487 family protein n=1 Tax=Ammoniphilus sp. CFH 90114 TaxID=2493665 RepID=UPI001F0BD05C|nr:DUF2487 family protein [Ammoniphilus sp. CFH 90114]